jgi:hypothetical protein
MKAFPGSETTNKLYERRFVGMIYTGININTDLVHSVNELQVQRILQHFIRYSILKLCLFFKISITFQSKFLAQNTIDRINLDKPQQKYD